MPRFLHDNAGCCGISIDNGKGGTMGKKLLLILCFFILCIWTQNSANARSAHNATVMDDIVVTSERFPSPEKESPQFIQSFSASELKRTGGNNVIDALRRIGGFSFQGYSPMGVKAGMGSSLSIRGVEGGELVLINGMPIQNSGNKNYELSHFSLENIERVEVIKGASSIQYGADAMSGAINIITKKNSGHRQTKASVEFGDYGYHNHHLQYLGPGVNVGFNYQHMNSIRRNDDFADKEYSDTRPLHRYSASVNATIAENLYFDGLASYVDSGYETYDATTGQRIDTNEQEQYEIFTNLRYETENARFKAFYKYGDEERKTYEYQPYKILDGISKNKHFNTGLSTDCKFDLLSAEVKTGFEYIHRAANFETGYGYHYRNDVAVFAIITKRFFQRLKIDLGMREQLIYADAAGEDQDEFTPSLGLNFRLTQSVNLFANAAKAFRAPSFNNLYYDSWLLKGNPELTPEKGWTYDAGVKFTNTWSKIRLSGFFMDYKDKIESYKGGGYPYEYFNAGTYESLGVDWNIDLFPFHGEDNWSSRISFYSSGTWCDPVAEDPDGRQYQTGPKFSSSVGAAYDGGMFSLALNFNYVTSRPDDLEDISTLDINGKYKLPKGYLTLGIDNVFDQEVEINGNKDTDNYVYYGMPRFFKIGYEVRF
jgi:iron complex outermembrane receptor protein